MQVLCLTACVCAFVNVRVSACVRACVRACMRAHVRVCMRDRVNAFIRPYAHVFFSLSHTDGYICTNTFTRIHTNDRSHDDDQILLWGGYDE